ncbi:hypothetical protein [Orenia marismortui]|uniref:Uncharacterized protein n=1 Tax=Orenia marismortui TaxID=46469 RepID=A0A4R8H297_9FIRM|nr:hypothetical protein [Orenia marismortui]TDX52493.1 hypothetical protein C7959_10656 [Orenia marismortui]
MENSKVSTKIRCKKYFKINSAEPIDPEDIKVTLKSQENNSPNEEDNSLFLPALWAYFQACQQGMLNDNSPVPWEEIIRNYLKSQTIDTSQYSLEEKEWILFLKYIMSDSNTIDWSDNKEVREFLLKAYNLVKAN